MGIGVGVGAAVGVGVGGGEGVGSGVGVAVDPDPVQATNITTKANQAVRHSLQVIASQYSNCQYPFQKRLHLVG